MSRNPFSDLYEVYGTVKKVNMSYYPKDFRDDIERYKGEERSMSGYEPSGYLHPDYSVLEGPRLDYYFWWRSEIDRGILPQVDSGYAWLRAVELINSADDPEEVLKALLRYAETCARSMRLSPSVCDLPLEYALVHGLSLASVPRARPFFKSKVLITWDLTRYPIREPDTQLLLDGIFYKWNDVLKKTDDGTMSDIVLMSLAGIDEFTRSTSGKGVVRSTGCEWEVEDIFPYSGYSDFSGQKHIRMPVVSLTEGPFHDLLEAIVRQAVALMRTDGVRGPSVPKAFPKAYRRIVAAAVDAAVRDDPWDAGMFRNASPPDGDVWKDDDLDVSMDDDAKPSLRPLPGAELGNPPITSREIDSNWDDESDEIVAYVPSGRMRASYRTMDDQQRAFYISWRTQARKGRYTDTDRGYLWLYCTELINHDYVPDNIQDELELAADAFYDAFPAPRFLFGAATDHALLHGLDAPPVPELSYSPAMVYEKLRRDPIGRISPGMARYCSDYASADKYTDGYERLYTEVFTEAYRAADAYCVESYGRRMCAMASEGRYKTHVRLYDDLWYPKRMNIDLTYANIWGSNRLLGIFDAVLKVCLRSVGKRIGRTSPRVPYDLDPKLVGAIEDAVDRAFERVEKEDAVAKAMKEASRISIDRSAVESAESDLKIVTGLMATGEEEGPEESPFEMSTGTIGDGWEALETALDAVEMDYLRYGSDALKGTGRRPQAVEESINNKAMDAVGDAIMENGTVFEDYAEEVRRMLG